MNKIINFLKSFPPVKKRQENWDKATDLLLEIARAHQKIAEDAAVYKAIFCVSPIVMIVVGAADGIIYEANQLFEEYTGFKRDEVIGKTIFELGFYHDPSAREKVVTRIITEGFIKNEPLVFVMKSGELKNGLLSSKLITRDNKKCLLSVIMDTTELDALRNRRIGDER